MKDNFAKINHISDDNRNIISDDNNEDRQNAGLSTFNNQRGQETLKRKQCNLSNDQFLNINSVK